MSVYAIPTDKPFVMKKRLAQTKITSHRKAVKEFCQNNDISFGVDENGDTIYIIAEEQTGRQTVGTVTGNE